MALELTHIRFAKDLHDKLRVINDEEYYAGSVYPDSRYVTKIDRNLAHQDGPQDPIDPSLGDFEKGWATHILYDRISMDEFSKFVDRIDEISQFNVVWSDFTAAKLLEDLISYEKMSNDLNLVLSVKSIASPNGEDVEELAKYYDALHDLYSSRPSIGRYGDFFKDFDAPDEAIFMMMQRASEMEVDDKFMSNVRGVYNKVLQEALAK